MYTIDPINYAPLPVIGGRESTACLLCADLSYDNKNQREKIGAKLRQWYMHPS